MLHPCSHPRPLPRALAAALLLCAAALPARADVTAEPPRLGLLPGGSVTISISPSVLVLGRDARAELTLVITDAAGQPLEPADLTVLVSTGRMERLEKDGPGHYRAWYRPPRVGYPHVAQVLVRGTGSAGTVAGVAVLPLWGQGQLVVETKPDAVVNVRIGDLAFGPVAANEKGTARVPIVSPPGPTLGVAEVVDPAGNETKQTVDLGVPDFNRLAVFGPREVVAGEVATCLVLAVDRRGSPLAEATLETEVEGGEPAVATQLRAGVWRLAVTAAPLKGRGRLVLRARLGGQKESHGEVVIPVREGPPVRASVTVTPRHVRAGETVQPRITARITDQHGNSTDASGATLHVDLGSAEEASAARGVLRARWNVGGRFDGRRAATVRVLGANGQELGTGTVTLLSARGRGSLRLGTAEPARDGSLPEGTWKIDVTTLDESGNPQPEAGVAVTSPDGALLLRRSPSTDGRTSLYVLPPTAQAGSTAAVVVRTDTGAAGSFTLPTRERRVPWLVVGPSLVGQWNFGRLLLGGAVLDTAVSWPLPLPRVPLRLALLGGVSAGLTAATPLAFSLSRPLNLNRLLFTAPVALHGGLEVGWRMLVLHATAGPGIVFSHARVKQPGQSVLALFGNLPPVGLPDWGEAARLSNVGPGVMGRVAGGVRWGPLLFNAQVRADVPLVVGGALYGFTGGLYAGAGVAGIVE